MSTTKHDGTTLLYICARNGHAEVAKLLLQRGADVDVPNVIGEEVTIGHRCVLHGATVGDRCLIGMGAILLGGSVIGEGSIIGAGAVVKEGMVVPPRSLVVGIPGRIVREVSEAQLEGIRRSADGYVQKVQQYLP